MTNKKSVKRKCRTSVQCYKCNSTIVKGDDYMEYHPTIHSVFKVCLSCWEEMIPRDNEVIYFYSNRKFPKRNWYGSWKLDVPFREWMKKYNLNTPEDIAKKVGKDNDSVIEIVTREEWLTYEKIGHFYALSRDFYQNIMEESGATNENQ